MQRTFVVTTLLKIDGKANAGKLLASQMGCYRGEGDENHSFACRETPF